MAMLVVMEGVIANGVMDSALGGERKEKEYGGVDVVCCCCCSGGIGVGLE